MTTNNQITNDNVTSSRESYNNNVSKLKYLGRSKRFSWNTKRSFRSI